MAAPENGGFNAFANRYPREVQHRSDAHRDIVLRCSLAGRRAGALARVATVLGQCASQPLGFQWRRRRVPLPDGRAQRSRPRRASGQRRQGDIRSAPHRRRFRPRRPRPARTGLNGAPRPCAPRPSLGSRSDGQSPGPSSHDSRIAIKRFVGIAGSFRLQARDARSGPLNVSLWRSMTPGRVLDASR